MDGVLLSKLKNLIKKTVESSSTADHGASGGSRSPSFFAVVAHRFLKN